MTRTKPLVLCGVENLILVETEDVMMVVRKDEITKIKDFKNIIS